MKVKHTAEQKKKHQTTATHQNKGIDEQMNQSTGSEAGVSIQSKHG